MWHELEEAGTDLGPTPVGRPERRWRYSDPSAQPPDGRCDDCKGIHVKDQQTLEVLLRGLSQPGWRDAPCTCPCCATY